MNTEERIYKRSRLMYIFEATLEYFISLLVVGSFLATLTSELGMSDSLTGILSSIISLGCMFQLLSIGIRRARVKSFVVLMSIINQLLFMLLYVVPIINVDKNIKIIIFIILIFSAYFIYNLVHPKKINWLMSLVDDHKRGSFTANKEIFSLITGMIFSFSMGALIDYFKEKGDIKTALILSAVVIFIVMIMHTLSMIFAIEKPVEKLPAKDLKSTIKDTVLNKKLLSISLVFIFYNISTYAATPFYGTYQIHELGFNLKLTTALTIIGSAVRIFVSKFWGRYADKNSFTSMMEKCLIFLALAFLCCSFAVPSNGKIMFAGYYIFHGIALGGISSALINLVFEYVAPEKRADSLAVCQATSGLAGFLTTLLISPLVTLIQNNGNKVFGIPLYAQQIISFLSFLVTATAVIYIKKVLRKK